MTRTSAWLALVAVALSAAACHAQEGRPRRLLLPRLSGRPSQVWAADVADQPGTPPGQALPPPTQDTPARGRPASPAPVLFPADPFPPPAPPVMDPRTLAWQQVNGPPAPGGLPPHAGPHHGPSHVPDGVPEVSAAPVRTGLLARVRARQAPAAWPEVRAPRAPAALPPLNSSHAVEGVPEAPAPLRRAGWSEPGTQTSSPPSTCSGPY